MTGFCKKIADSDDFQRFILLLILISAACMGIEAVPALRDMYDAPLYYADIFIRGAFVAEIAIRLMSYAPNIPAFFRDRWNRFDFIIVVASLLPMVGSFALIARLLRLLRVLRFFSASSGLRNFIGRLQESFDELAGALLIAGIAGYIFVIGGFYMFGDIDPAHWGSLREAVISVFYLSLLQDVASYAGPLIDHTLFSLLYFIVFYTSLAGLGISVIVAAVLQGQAQHK